MPLSIEKRLRIIELYCQHQLHFTKGRFYKLKLFQAVAQFHNEQLQAAAQFHNEQLQAAAEIHFMLSTWRYLKR